MRLGRQDATTSYRIWQLWQLGHLLPISEMYSGGSVMFSRLWTEFSSFTNKGTQNFFLSCLQIFFLRSSCRFSVVYYRLLTKYDICFIATGKVCAVDEKAETTCWLFELVQEHDYILSVRSVIFISEDYKDNEVQTAVHSPHQFSSDVMQLSHRQNSSNKLMRSSQLKQKTFVSAGGA